MKNDFGRFIISRPIAGLIRDGFDKGIRETIANVHWYTHYTLLFHGLKKDRNKHVSSITKNVASVLVF